MSPLGDDKLSLMPVGWGKRLIGIHRLGHPFQLIIKISFCRGHILSSIHIRKKYFHFFFLNQDGPSTYHFSNFICNLFSNRVYSKPLITGYNRASVYDLTSGHSYLKVKCTARYTALSFDNWEDFPYHSPSGTSQRGDIVAQLSLFG